jgi:hypothetical protein
MCCLVLSVFILSNGDMYVPDKPGVQKSGVKITGSFNSHSRTAWDLLVGAWWSFVMGDDDVCDSSANYDLLRCYGIPTKDVIDFSEGEKFEFLSHQLGAGTMIPLKPAKMLCEILHKTPDQALLVQFQYELRNHPEREFYVSEVYASGWAEGLPALPLAVVRQLREN